MTKGYASWLLAYYVHLLLAAVLIWYVQPKPLLIEPLLKVDLTMMEEPESVIVMPPPAPPPPPPECEQVPAPPEAPAEAAPLPMDKTLVLTEKEPAGAPAAPEIEEPEPAEPDVETISPVKVPVELPEKERDKGEDKGDRIDVRKGDIIVHRGHEARFGRTMMADYFSYSASEFSGQFTTRDNRTVTIIDARNTEYGRFLIYDSKNKTLRRLKEFSKYVYTIGPSLEADEPVIGVVTFLAKNDRIERFVLTTDDDRFAHYPTKIHVREDNVTFAAPAGELKGTTTLPPDGSGHFGVVFLPGACIAPGMVQGVTRSLASRGLASLFMQTRGCNDGETLAAQDILAEDAAAGLRFLSDTPRLKDGRIGLWGNGPGAPVALAAVDKNGARPDFLVCLLNDEISPAALPGPKRLRRLNMPVLWIITGQKTREWRPFITMLEKLRDQAKRPFTIVISPRAGSREINNAKSDLSHWVEQVAEDHAKLATSWIKSLKR
ncbi:hypothetical protein [Pseudodesulfovibrio sp.]|uniref:hypothetical protein n=1 Tax=unclassified Pseudodesulfovibrio TaxID=2661612 RepID=UPI003B00AC7A